MKQHPFRWEGLVFGLFFLSIAASWAVWDQDLLSPRQLSLTASGALIVLGLVGVAATVRQSRPSPAAAPADRGEADDETADVQP